MATDPPPPMPRPSGPDPAFWALLLVAAALRVAEALRTPLWFDEVYTLRLAQAPWDGLWRLMSQDVHPPLHGLLVWSWVHTAGDAMPWLKTLPVVCGVLTVAVTYAFAREALGRPAAWLAGAFVAMHPFLVYLSQELRSFALLTLALSVTTWMGWRWVAWGRRRDGAFYVAAAAAALYVHYLAGLALAMLGLWGLVALARAPRRAAGWIGLNALVLALFAPQVPTFLAQVQRQEDHWVRRPLPGDLLNLLRKQSFGNLKLVPVVAALGLLAWRPRRTRAAVALLWLAGPLTVALAWAIGRAGPHVFTERYMSFALPPLMALCAAGALSLPWRPAAWLVAIGLLAVEGRALALHAPHEEGVSLGRVARALRASWRAGDVIYAGDTHSYLTLEQHLGADAVRLVLRDGRLPYWEGDAVIPRAARVLPGEVGDGAAAGARWWAVRMRTGGIPSDWTVPLFDSLAAGRARYGPVTVWYARGDMRPAGADDAAGR